MPTAQQQRALFSPEEAQRFAALWAGFETGNLSEPEAVGKGRILRRMVAEKNIRLIDALELPEIRKAIDAQLQPVRQPVPDVAALKKEIEDLRGKLAVAVPKVRELAALLKKERNGQGVLWATWIALALDACIAGFSSGQMWPLVVGLICAGAVVFGVGFEGRGAMDFIDTVKEKALIGYTVASYIFFGIGLLTYLACCIVAGGPVGPVTYIGFLYHCAQWKVS